MKHNTWRAWFDLSVSVMPVLVMGFLAAWSYWLVRTTPGAAEPSDRAQASQMPDVRLTDFTVENYGNLGQLDSRITGTQAWHHPEDDSMEVQGAQLWSARPRETQASGQQLWVGAGQTQYRLSGNATIVQQSQAKGGAPLTVRSEELFLDDSVRQISSAKPVEVRQGARVLRGERMHYDQNAGVLDLRGRVAVTQPGVTQ